MMRKLLLWWWKWKGIITTSDFLFFGCKSNFILRNRQGLRKSGSGKILRSQARAVFPARPLDCSPYSVGVRAGKREKMCPPMQRVCAVCASPCGVCILQEVSLSDILAFLALLKRILRLPLCSWNQDETRKSLSDAPPLRRRHFRNRHPGAV